MNARRNGVWRVMSVLDATDAPSAPSQHESVSQDKTIVEVVESMSRAFRVNATLNRFRRREDDEKPKRKEPRQEVVDVNGALSPERRAELRDLRMKLQGIMGRHG